MHRSWARCSPKYVNLDLKYSAVSESCCSPTPIWVVLIIIIMVINAAIHRIRTQYPAVVKLPQFRFASDLCIIWGWDNSLIVCSPVALMEDLFKEYIGWRRYWCVCVSRQFMIDGQMSVYGYCAKGTIKPAEIEIDRLGHEKNRLRIWRCW